MVATSVTKKEGRDVTQWSRHQLQRMEVATSFSGHDISYKERRSRCRSVVATSVARKQGRDVTQWSRHQLQRMEVATSFSGRDISCKELRSRRHLAVATSTLNHKRSRRHLAVATSDPRNAKSKSQPNKSLCDVAETTEVATKNRGRDINNQMGQLI